MPILLDDEPIPDGAFAPDATVAQLLDVAQARLEGSGSVIVALRHDDQDVPAERLEQMLSQPVAGFGDLQLVSGRPVRVVLDALEQIRLAFAETFAGIKKAADDLTAGKISDGMNTLAECTGIWARTHESIVQSGALVGLDFDHLQIAERPIVEWLNGLAARLREIKDAIEAHDTVLLGDILRYEFDETLRQWERMLDGIIAHVEQLDDAMPMRST